MTRRFALAAVLCSTLVLAAPARAQTAGDCALGTAQADLDFSDVQARVFNTGSLFFGNGSQAAYLVPRTSDKSPVYAAGLWLGGEIGGTLRVAGATYRDFEFWPGPLDDGAVLPNPGDCSAYDRIYLVSVLDVSDYEATGTAIPDLAEWPVGLGAPAVDSEGLPVEPSSREQTIDLDAGERPVLSGSQTAFWVMNDVGNDHENTGGGLLGVEVAVTAFSIASQDPAFDQTTVYRYRITNRNSQTISGFVAGFFADPDLGDFQDDYIGVDVERGLGFVYNADDSDGGAQGYGVPPAFGVDFLSGNFGTHIYFTNANTGDPQTDPQDAEGYYSFLQGLWGDGTPMTAFGDGYQDGGGVTTFAFPGDPVSGQFWSEVNLDGTGTDSAPGDRRSLLATAPRTLAPGDFVQFDLGMVFGQGTGNFDSITKLRAASDIVQAAYDDGSLFAPADVSLALAQPQLVSPEDGAMFGDEDVTLVWQPVQFADEYLLTVATRGTVIAAPVVQGTSFVVDNDLLPASGVPELVSWSVRARGDDNGATVFSPLSETRTFTVEREPAPDFLALGDGIVEVARPGGAVCPDGTDDAGCALGLGNTVWLDADAVGDYRITTDNSAGLERIRVNVAKLAPFAAEIRFTDGEHYGLDFGVSSSSEVWSVPFEIWNIGTTPDDPSDDIRMIPLLISEPGETEFVWADSFPREDPLLAGVSATSRVYAAMPDRPEGYALFAAAAQASGVGSVYVDTDNTDTPIDNGNLGIGDVDPTTGELCENRGDYISYCYRNDQTSPVEGAGDAGNTLVWPIGRIVFSDLAGDGTTPPAGTVVRFNTTDVDTFPVDEEGTGEAAGVWRLLAPRPNPSRGSVEVPFELGAAGTARLTVVDALGREVARLVDGEVAAGAQRATLDGRALAAGVYVLVLETGGERLTRTLTVLR